jgi:hypothetical protein
MPDMDGGVAYIEQLWSGSNERPRHCVHLACQETHHYAGPAAAATPTKFGPGWDMT